MRKVFLFLLIASTTQWVAATHLMGGEFHLETFSSQVRFELYLYFDELNGNPGAKDLNIQASIVRKRDEVRVESVSLSLIQEKLISNQLACGGSSFLANKITYRSNFLSKTKFNDPGGYYIIWHRCCRNNAINNISQPGATGMAYYLEFTNLDDKQLETPILKEPQKTSYCSNNVYDIDFGIINNTNSDSIRYRLFHPFRGLATNTSPILSSSNFQPGTGAPILWQPGFSAQNPFGSGSTFDLNTQNGVFRINNPYTGLFLFSLEVLQYKNGEVWSKTVRDFQLLFNSCPSEYDYETLIYQQENQIFNNDTVILNVENRECLKILFNPTDTAFGQLAVTISEDNFFSSFQRITFDDGLESDSIIYCPELNCSATSAQYLDVAIQSNALECEEINRDFKSFTIEIPPVVNKIPEVELSFSENELDTIRISELTNFFLNARDSNANFTSLSWEVFEGQSTLNLLGIEEESLSLANQAFYKNQLKVQCDQFNLDQLQDTLVFRLTESFCDIRNYYYFEYPIYVEHNSIYEIEPLPNLLTPNGDGKNEILKLPNFESVFCKPEFGGFTVYNRWGKEIHNSNNPNLLWEANNTPDGLYFYSLILNEQVLKGWIQVVK